MKHAKNLERLSEIIAFILFLAGGQIISKAKLVKLIYLLDVIQTRRGHPYFSGIQFQSYYAGPYSKEIEGGISLLLQRGHLAVTAHDHLDGNSYYHFQLHRLPPFGQLTTAEQEEIQDSLKALIHLEVKELLTMACCYQRVSRGVSGGDDCAMKWPFTVHRETKFEKLINQLLKLEIIELEKDQEAYLLVIRDQETLLEIFSTLFLFYAIPAEVRKLE